MSRIYKVYCVIGVRSGGDVSRPGPSVIIAECWRVEIAYSIFCYTILVVVCVDRSASSAAVDPDGQGRNARWSRERAIKWERERERELVPVSEREKEFRERDCCSSTQIPGQSLKSWHWFLLQDRQLDESTSRRRWAVPNWFGSVAFLRWHCVNMLKCQPTNKSWEWHQWAIIYQIFSTSINGRAQWLIKSIIYFSTQTTLHDNHGTS